MTSFSLKNFLTAGACLATALHLSLGWAGAVDEARAAFERKDYATGVKLSLALAQAGNPEAQLTVGISYLLGQGVVKDMQQAVEWLRKAADQGNAVAQYNLGVFYTGGQGVVKDERQGVEWYRKAAEQGMAVAQFNLGLAFMNGRGVSKDDRQGFDWYRKAAVQGNVDAQYTLGRAFQEGQGVAKDDQQAVEWYRKAAAQGDALAQSAVGFAYLKGKGVVQDERQAAEWNRKAADQGLATAQFNLGVAYTIGQGVTKDDRQAFDWFLKSAEQGNVGAQNSLGVAYMTGQGVIKDERQGYDWFRKAADQGDKSAQSNLARAFMSGQGVAKDERQAVDLYRKAAEQGYPSAQFELGKAYRFGKGGVPNPPLAYFWFLLASNNSDASVAQATRGQAIAVEGQLGATDRLAAQKAASAWTVGAAEPVLKSEAPPRVAQAPNPPTPVPAPAPAPEATGSTGSGFHVGAGFVVTNNHVVQGCSRFTANGMPSKVVNTDQRSDLAVLRVQGLQGAVVGIRAERLRVGEDVAVAGFPLHGILSGFILTRGNVSSLNGLEGDTRLLQITAPVQRGNSGGPLVDNAGNVVGVIVSKLSWRFLSVVANDLPQNINFAIKTNTLMSFLDASNVNYQQMKSKGKELSPADMAERARGFTVLVECH